MKKSYAITDKRGQRVKTGMFTEPELRMAAKAGFRVFEINEFGDRQGVEITQGLTGLFTGYKDEFKN